VDAKAPSAPTITSPANNSYNKDGVVTISGTAEAGSTVTVVDNASSPTTKTATADSNTGAWSVTFGSSSSKLADATYTYSATAKDTAGNISSASTRKVTVDKTAPTVTASSVSPTSGATKVARNNTSVMASFSEKIDPTTLISTPTASANPNVGISTTFTLVKSGTTTPIINAKVSYDDSTKKVTLTPSTSLAARTKYTAKLSSGVKDLAGNALTAYTWSFTTGS
jgi:hypothetical protein